MKCFLVYLVYFNCGIVIFVCGQQFLSDFKGLCDEHGMRDFGLMDLKRCETAGKIEFLVTVDVPEGIKEKQIAF